jgi:hypothetical protein
VNLTLSISNSRCSRNLRTSLSRFSISRASIRSHDISGVIGDKPAECYRRCSHMAEYKTLQEWSYYSHSHKFSTILQKIWSDHGIKEISSGLLPDIKPIKKISYLYSLWIRDLSYRTHVLERHLPELIIRISNYIKRFLGKVMLIHQKKLLHTCNKIFTLHNYIIMRQGESLNNLHSFASLI